MEQFIIYNFKSALILLFLMLIYNAFFRKENYYLNNRIYLIFSILFSFSVPLFKFQNPGSIPINISGIETDVREIIVYSGNNPESTIILPFWLYLYLIPAFIFLLLFIFRFYKIFSIFKQKSFTKEGKYYIAKDNSSNNSFSFFNRIIIGTKGISNNEIEMIIEHEKYHAMSKHSLDIFIIEVLKVIQWFNPAIYMLSKNIVLNHEYSADRNTLEFHPITEYKELIAKSITNTFSYPINSFFNKSLIKQRFDMLQNRKPKTSVLKYFTLFPLFLILFIVVACSERDEAFNSALNYSDIFMDSKYDENNSNAKFSGNIYEYTEKYLTYPEKAKDDGVLAKLHYNVVIDTDGSIIAYEYLNAKFIDLTDKIKYLSTFKENAQELLMNMPKWEPALKNGNPVRFIQMVGIVFGEIERWKQMNPPDLMASSKEGWIETVRTEKNSNNIKHLYYYDLMLHIIDNIEYPENAKSNGIEANVILEVNIDKNGNITEAELLSVNLINNNEELGTDDIYGFTDEAIKTVKSAKALPPAEDKNGNPVETKFKLPVSFKLKSQL